jgi:oxygen-independent coproporphyrinogen-3 oxidase
MSQALRFSEAEIVHFLGSGPRYTSYPTVPVWNHQVQAKEWKQHLALSDRPAEIALYVHIPFCEKLCHFCACNRVIDPLHAQDEIYIQNIVLEIASLGRRLGGVRVGQLHWGGGTPTYLRPYQIQRVMRAIRDHLDCSALSEASIEVHPNVTTLEHLKVLAELGFNRLSIGVQDFDPQVQDIINRFQTYENTERVVQECRQLGFSSVNLDLIYGLPRQTREGLKDTICKVGQLKPDRLAFYSYANVPWKQPFQRRFSDAMIPQGFEKLQLYLSAREQLMDLGYCTIGMDHFALPTDELWKVTCQNQLHRNFMGYTTRERPLVGLGVSAISDYLGLYAQNERQLTAYYRRLKDEGLATQLGHRMSKDDQIRRAVILNLMCFKDIVFEGLEHEFGIDPLRYFDRELRSLTAFEEMGLLTIDKNQIAITERGKLFVRNIAMTFDSYLEANKGELLFSKTI